MILSFVVEGVSLRSQTNAKKTPETERQGAPRRRPDPVGRTKQRA
jgi:hypothetical protein